MTIARRHILITGFEPFPTQPVNATAVLAPLVAREAQRAFPDARIRADVLPTEWRSGPWQMEDSVLAQTPDAAIFFGIASRAKGFEIEMRGRNERADTFDAAGCKPDAQVILPDGPPHLAATLPTSDIIRRLRRRGIPVLPSRNAGIYLCNALLFHGLNVSRYLPRLRQVGFVHLPAELGVPGRRQTEVNRSCPIRWSEAVLGGVEIVGACLGRPVPGHIAQRWR